MPSWGGRDQARGRGRGSPRGGFPIRGRGSGSDRWQTQSQQRQGFPTQFSGSTGFNGVKPETGQKYDYNTSHGPWRPSASGHEQVGSPPRTAAGHKRKLDALRGAPQKKLETKPAPATAPSIPTFGAPVLATDIPPSSRPTHVTSNGKLNQKPPGRSLGLTPGSGDPQYPSSEDENEEVDVDEEAVYAELGDKLTFEHNGVVMSLNSPADVLVWKQDRRKNWPTKARMAIKDEERRRIGEERMRLLAGVDALYGSKSPFAKPGSNIWVSGRDTKRPDTKESVASPNGLKTAKCETDLEKAQREMVEKTQRLEELRRKVAESEIRNRKARELAEQSQTPEVVRDDELSAQDASAIAEGPTDSGILPEHQSSALDDQVDAASPSASADASSSASDAENSSDDDDDSDDDGPPDEMSSKPPANLAALGSTSSPSAERPICRYFRASGHCRDGDGCQFRHEGSNQRPQQQQSSGHPDRSGHVRQELRRSKPAEQQSGGRKTIFQRLVEQEEVADDALALKVVRYLGEAGFFAAAS